MIFLHFIKPDLINGGHGLLSMGWKPPTAGFVKLNTDGSFFDNGGAMGGGGLVRDSSGSWVAGFLFQEVVGSTFLAEALAFIHGLKFTWEHGAWKLLCKSDCKDLVQVIAYPKSARVHVHGAVITEIQHMLKWR